VFTEHLEHPGYPPCGELLSDFYFSMPPIPPIARVLTHSINLAFGP